MGVDHFDRLSDDLLRVIFNRVVDANSLGCCLCVSKRFASVVSQTKAIALVIPRRTIVQPPSNRSVIKSTTNFVKTLKRKLIIKPLKFLHRTIVCNSSSSTATATATTSFNNSEVESLFCSVDKVLKGFKEIESLKLILPIHPIEEELYSSGDGIIKWKAESGSELKSCVILFAKSVKKARPFSYVKFDDYFVIVRYENGENQDPEDSTISHNGETQLQETMMMVFILDASAGRHQSLAAPIIPNQRMLRKLEVTDEKERGKLCMNEEQIAEMRKRCVTTTASTIERMSVDIRYVPVLELPETGMVMEGVTLAVVKVFYTTDSLVNDNGAWLEGAFDGDKEEKVLNEAVREMMKTEATFTCASDMSVPGEW